MARAVNGFAAKSAGRIQQTGRQISIDADQNAEAIRSRLCLQQEGSSQDEQTEICDILANFLGKRIFRMCYGRQKDRPEPAVVQQSVSELARLLFPMVLNRLQA